MKRLYLITLLLLFLIGAGIYAFSFRYDWYKVSEQELGELSSQLADKPRDQRWDEWYDETHKLETPRKMLHDIGVGIGSLSVVLTSLYFLYGFPLKKCKTPKNRWRFILLYLLALAAQVPASLFDP